MGLDTLLALDCDFYVGDVCRAIAAACRLSPRFNAHTTPTCPTRTLSATRPSIKYQSSCPDSPPLSPMANKLPQIPHPTATTGDLAAPHPPSCRPTRHLYLATLGRSKPNHPTCIHTNTDWIAVMRSNFFLCIDDHPPVWLTLA